MKKRGRNPVRIFRIAGVELGSLQGAGWMALFTAQFWRALIFNRLWLGLVPVETAAFVVMFLLYHYVADFSVRTALLKGAVYCLWSALCYGIGVWSVVCRRLGIDRGDDEETDEEAEFGNYAGAWIVFLVLSVLGLLFACWLLWPALGYWIWDKGDSTQAVIGPLFKGLLVAAFLCPVVWNHRLEK